MSIKRRNQFLIPREKFEKKYLVREFGKYLFWFYSLGDCFGLSLIRWSVTSNPKHIHWEY